MRANVTNADSHGRRRAAVLVTVAAILLALPACERAEEGTLPTSLPAAAGPPTAPSGGPQPIEIIVKPRPDGLGDCYYLGDESALGPDELFARLNSLGDRDTPVIIKPHPRVRWTSVVNAFNVAVRAGFKAIGFAPGQEQGTDTSPAAESLPAATETDR